MKEAKYSISVSSEFNGKTIKELLTTYGFSSKNQYLIDINQGIYLNNQPARLHMSLNENDLLSFIFDSIIQNKVISTKHKIDILYEDDSILVVNKDNQTLIYDEQSNHALINYVAYYKLERNYPYEILPVHRIDLETTGMVIFGKNPLVVSYLSKRFEEKEIIKDYLCLTRGPFKEKKGAINLAIGQDRHDNKMRVSSTGKEATSIYEVLDNGQTSTVKVTIIGGRKHQIRVHLSYIGHPIIGDKIYSKDQNVSMHLHFYRVSFKDPKTFQTIEIISKPWFDVKGLNM